MSELPREVAPGVHVLVLPTPFHVGDVNAVLVQAERLTLVDCGPATTAAFGSLERQLAVLGVALTDLDLLLLTHPHPDHFGTAAEIVRRTGVRVAGPAAGAPVFEGWTRWAQEADAGIGAELARHGMPADVVSSQHLWGFVQHALAEDVVLDERLVEGDVVDLGDRRLDALLLPGHSPADMAFVDADARLLLAGDVLVSRMGSNALPQRITEPWDGPRPRSLRDYRRSLQRVAELDVAVTVGGHGAPFAGHRELVRERLEAQDRRAARLLGLLAHGPRTAHELSRELWGAKALQQPYATMSMVLGHLDLLADAGAVVEQDCDGVSRFASARERAFTGVDRVPPTPPRVRRTLEIAHLGSIQEGGARW